MTADIVAAAAVLGVLMVVVTTVCVVLSIFLYKAYKRYRAARASLKEGKPQKKRRSYHYPLPVHSAIEDQNAETQFIDHADFNPIYSSLPEGEKKQQNPRKKAKLRWEDHVERDSGHDSPRGSTENISIISQPVSNPPGPTGSHVTYANQASSSRTSQPVGSRITCILLPPGATNAPPIMSSDLQNSINTQIQNSDYHYAPSTAVPAQEPIYNSPARAVPINTGPIYIKRQAPDAPSQEPLYASEVGSRQESVLSAQRSVVTLPLDSPEEPIYSTASQVSHRSNIVSAPQSVASVVPEAENDRTSYVQDPIYSSASEIAHDVQHEHDPVYATNPKRAESTLAEPEPIYARPASSRSAKTASVISAEPIYSSPSEVTGSVPTSGAPPPPPLPPGGVIPPSVASPPPPPPELPRLPSPPSSPVGSTREAKKKMPVSMLLA